MARLIPRRQVEYSARSFTIFYCADIILGLSFSACDAEKLMNAFRLFLRSGGLAGSGGGKRQKF